MGGLVVSVVGPGALGQAYAAGLAAAGAEVAVVARAERSRELVEAGEVRISGALERRIPLTTEGARAGRIFLTSSPLPHGGIIFAVKGYDLLAAARRFVGARAPWVVGVQNGIGKDDRLADLYGADAVVGEVGMLAAERGADGGVVVTNPGLTYLGELDGSSSDRVRALVDALSAGGIPAEATSEIRSLEWSKLVNVAATFGVDLIARSVWGTSMENEHLGRAFLSLFREASEVARSEGAHIRDLPGIPSATYLSIPEQAALALRAERAAKIRATGGVLDRRSSILQDLLRGRPLEADAIFGDLVERAERHGVQVPRLTLVLDIARALDPRGQLPA